MSNSMNKSAKGSMFDGLQIFGKTDAKFSMPNSFHSSGSSSSRPLHNSNYQFDNESSVLPPPGPVSEARSLPFALNEEELPPDSYPIEPMSLDPRQMNSMPAVRNMQQYQHGARVQTVVSDSRYAQPISTQRHTALPKTWARSDVSSKVESSEPPHKPAQDELAPLQKVSFRNTSPLQPSVVRDEPPPLPSYPPEPDIKSESDRTSYFFTNASSEIKKFEQDLDEIEDNHSQSSSQTLKEMHFCEDSIKAVSLLSIQKLLKFEASAKLVEELRLKIKSAIESNSYEEAENLQNSLDDALKEMQQSQLLQFQPPRQLDSTEKQLRTLNTTRKSHVESLKNFCVSLDELSTKFKSITKKIEVQCSSKIDKQKQELEAAQNALDCRVKHSTIDKEYLEQREKNLIDELRVTADDHNLQMRYQDELLEGVQSEIRVLEERLKKLRSQENAILVEKQKLIVEKVENEKLHQQKSLDLKKEKDNSHIKEVSLKNEKTSLSKRSAQFDSYSSKLDNISNYQNKVNCSLTELKSKTCEDISANEGLIVNEVHVSVNTDASKRLTIPESLSDIINEISTHEKLLELKSNDVFDHQCQISRLRSDELMARTNLQNCKGLKTEAINKKRFQEAAKLSKEEAEIDAQLASFADKIVEMEKTKQEDEVGLESYSNTLKELQGKAAKQQSVFDKECYEALVSDLMATLSALKALPPEITTISRALLEYDACYTYSFLKMLKHRSKDVDEGSGKLSRDCINDVELLMKKIASEAKSLNTEAVKLKAEIDEALRNEDFDTAEVLNAKYDLIVSLHSDD